ncbi:hypothetical protein AA13595_2776 [Gluconacetobacter johannae DSM 13595]|uniref:DUF2849 domain-containing protein n=1 Tax=Gluconacetobacter johannae TaxID=112140 RepID=A0A7W4P3X6_9PROT|nr:DUF2849 domain-containing protein [Gluconacetobacter johannae]MBB2176502.1 DUF2849 domain-containing protein [Gluconacetobacter johannae]GBQ89949.1 hypothetical protein AA13595_2776 [Gluconacetobacter johannae DSM 13595]
MDVRNNRRQAGGSSVVTANRLLDGRIVWLAEDGAWSGRIDAARIFSNDGIEAVIDATARRQQADGVVGVYGVQISDDSTTPVPVTVRERIRAFGPTVHPEFATLTEVPSDVR